MLLGTERLHRCPPKQALTTTRPRGKPVTAGAARTHLLGAVEQVPVLAEQAVGLPHALALVHVAGDEDAAHAGLQLPPAAAGPLGPRCREVPLGPPLPRRHRLRRGHGLGPGPAQRPTDRHTHTPTPAPPPPRTAMASAPPRPGPHAAPPHGRAPPQALPAPGCRGRAVLPRVKNK